MKASKQPANQLNKYTHKYITGEGRREGRKESNDDDDENTQEATNLGEIGKEKRGERKGKTKKGNMCVGNV